MRIADPERLDRSVVKGDTSIVPIANTKPQGDASGQLAMGKAISELGETITTLHKRRTEREQKMQYSKALSEWNTRRIGIETEFENDRDYQTRDQRYQERLKELQDEITETIDNPELKQGFILDTNVDSAQGLARIAGKTYQIERDINRAEVLNVLQSNEETILNAQDSQSRQNIIKDSADIINTAVEAGYYTAQEGEELKDTFKQKYAMTRLQALDPLEQLDAINNAPWAKFVPKSERDKVKRAAQAIVDKRKQKEMIMEKSMNIIAKNSTIAGRYNAANKITDPDIRDGVLDEIDDAERRMKMIKEEQEEALNDFVVQRVLSGEMLTKDIPPEIEIQMDKSELAYIKQWEKDKGRPSEEERWLTYADYLETVTDSPHMIKQYTPGYIMAHFPDDKREQVLEARMKYQPGEVVISATDAQKNRVIKSRLAEFGIKEGDKKSESNRTLYAAVQKTIDEQFTEYQKQNDGQAPDITVIGGWVDDLMEKHTFNDWVFNDAFRKIEIPEDWDRWDDLIVPDDAKNQILKEVQDTHPGVSINDDQIRQIYIINKNLR